MQQMVMGIIVTCDIVRKQILTNHHHLLNQPSVNSYANRYLSFIPLSVTSVLPYLRNQRSVKSNDIRN